MKSRLEIWLMFTIGLVFNLLVDIQILAAPKSSKELSMSTYSAKENTAEEAPGTTFLPFPDMRVFHTQSFFRTQTNAVWLVLVNAPSSVNMNVVLSPDPNFTITHINAPATWTCNIGTNTCTRVNDGATNVFEFIQVVGTISSNAPTTITNAATLTEASLVNPVVKNDIAQVYNPSKVFQ
jgi:hypothetical protein